MLTQALGAGFFAAALAMAAPATAQEVDDAAPLPPTGSAATFVPPAHDATGYQTLNRGLSPEETTWHVRVALNVAALGCRGPNEAATTAAYNTILRADAAALAAAASGTEGVYKARHGTLWQARYDDDMTRLYNFFAQPPAHDGFCEAAEAVLRQSATVEPSSFPAFAAAALPRLEAPFIAFFASYDDYRASLAAWKARHTAVVIATASAPPVGPAAAPVAQVVAASVSPTPTTEPAAPVLIASVSVPATPAFGPQP